MPTASDPDRHDAEAERTRPARPKRGAIPTPEAVIEMATPYVPDEEDGDEVPMDDEEGKAR
jgi:hypothetical protein